MWKLFMENVQNKNPGDYDINTPLHLAAEFGNSDICKFISKNVQNKNPGDDNGISAHEVKKPFKCEVSDYSYSQKGELKKHVVPVHESVHEGKKTFLCEH